MCNIDDAVCVAALASIGSAVAAVLAAGVTAWMAVETRRMATATKRSVDLEFLPLLGIRDVKIGVSSTSISQAGGPDIVGMNSISVALELQNAGRVSLKYVMKAMRVTFADRTTDSPTFLSRSDTILPGSSSQFFHPTLKLDPPVTKFPARGRIACEFEYFHDDSAPPKTLKATFEYTVSGPSEGAQASWRFVDDGIAT